MMKMTSNLTISPLIGAFDFLLYLVKIKAMSKKPRTGTGVGTRPTTRPKPTK